METGAGDPPDNGGPQDPGGGRQSPPASGRSGQMTGQNLQEAQDQPGQSQQHAQSMFWDAGAQDQGSQQHTAPRVDAQDPASQQHTHQTGRAQDPASQQPPLSLSGQQGNQTQQQALVQGSAQAPQLYMIPEYAQAQAQQDRFVRLGQTNYFMYVSQPFSISPQAEAFVAQALQRPPIQKFDTLPTRDSTQNPPGNPENPNTGVSQGGRPISIDSSKTLSGEIPPSPKPEGKNSPRQEQGQKSTDLPGNQPEDQELISQMAQVNVAQDFPYGAQNRADAAKQAMKAALARSEWVKRSREGVPKTPLP